MVLSSTALVDNPLVLSQRYTAPSLGLISKSSPKLSCDHVRISRVVPVTAAIPQPVKSSSDDALPTATEQLLHSECVVAVVPLCPLATVSCMYHLIVPAVITIINIFTN